MSSILIVSIIHLVAIALWAADSRVLEYVVKKFKFRRSMPKPAAVYDNQFIVDKTKEKDNLDSTFRELIESAYGSGPGKPNAGRWDIYGKKKIYWNTSWAEDEKKSKNAKFYKREGTLEPLLDSILDELEKTEPEIYKIILRKHFLKNKRRQKPEE